MGARRVARERVLQALYELESNWEAPLEALAHAWAASEDEGLADPAAQAFARELLEGIASKRDDIDALLERHSHNWRLDRMSKIDRNVLRMGVFELAFRQDIPRKVTINEAIEVGKAFGTEDSSAFINGLLDRIADAVKKA